jgi:DNA modification methylase
LFTKPGDLVLDPFLGSGTTALAAAKLGRNYLGIEIREDYCSLARKSIKDELGETLWDLSQKGDNGTQSNAA